MANKIKIKRNNGRSIDYLDAELLGQQSAQSQASWLQQNPLFQQGLASQQAFLVDSANRQGMNFTNCNISGFI